MSETESAENKPTEFHIQIDRVEYHVAEEELTGIQLRHLPHPPIGPERDLFEIIPGQADRKIDDHYVVEIVNGKRLFTAPAHINPGSRRAPRASGSDDAS